MESNLKSLLLYADAEGFAVPAFNYGDLWELKGILLAAEEQRAPVIIATNDLVSRTHSLGLLGPLGRLQETLSSVPVVNHLDHCREAERCKEAIGLGYASVMFDGSPLPLEENIRLTKSVVEHARLHGAHVEAEVGHIRGSGEEGGYQGDDALAAVADVVAMAEETGVDSLAIGLGNAHGFYTQEPRLDFDRLREINEAVSTPLVLHGGSGIPEHIIREAIRGGINKVNVGTTLHHAYIQALGRKLEAEPDIISIVELMEPVVQAVKGAASALIRTCMANDRVL